ncbi:hypothetical protein MOX02_52040 [Methylobacterium oxalidis]|uniref:DNA-binding protein n=1 Tax=Methylobacterium oxalidis TaxID=944322 RepID=A0A512JB45_9HYPH|nr:hypothetical protein MOX02_52040 [Methylobacterium oxalidis]GJE31108.1 hypothetical protein LDDCCGHA_1281 [Methylobacterium oxalidis]GLS64421.1 hypothetical protein GCM10007888_28020 [Methylobacterium oxalidis]
MNKMRERTSRYDEHEPLLTFRQAAATFGVPYWKIQRAAKLGLIPTITLLNSRRYVRGSEIEQKLLMHPARVGGVR